MPHTRTLRRADPYRDLAVIDARAPRFNQAVVGLLSLAAVLTGMGGDGGKGVRLVKARGGRVIAESADTAVIFGMPQEVQDALAANVPFPSRLGTPADYAKLVHQIVTNEMLNGEVIRLDGAIRLAPK